MKSYPLLFPLIFMLWSCSSNEDIKNVQEETKNPYANFSTFPENQFSSIRLGIDLTAVENKISQIGGKLVAIEESLYYLVGADSTEILIPNRPVLTAFKIFMRGSQYLNDATSFKAFLCQKADRIHENESFSIFYFESTPIPFKLTYFLQSTFIRLNFTLIEIHS